MTKHVTRLEQARYMHGMIKARSNLIDLIFIADLAGVTISVKPGIMNPGSVSISKLPRPDEPGVKYTATHQWSKEQIGKELGEKTLSAALWLLLDHYFRAKDSGLAP